MAAQFFSQANSVSVSPVVSREVIRSHYINSSYPDMTRVILTQTTPRESSTYSCTVYVNTRTGVGTGPGYAKMPLGSGTSTASFTGECCTLLTTSPPPPPLSCKPSTLLLWSAGLVSTVFWSPGLPPHQHQLVMRCSTR